MNRHAAGVWQLASVSRLLQGPSSLHRTDCAPALPSLPAPLQVPLSGSGFTNAASFLNKFQWRFSSLLVGQGIHGRTAKAVVKRAAEQLQVRGSLLHLLNCKCLFEWIPLVSCVVPCPCWQLSPAFPFVLQQNQYHLLTHSLP